MLNDEWQKLAEQQEALLVAVAEIKNYLDANDWRRKCLWQLAGINRIAENLQETVY